MKQTFTLHTHTAGFDGRHTEQEMVARAADMGFAAIGVSNHFIVHPNIRQTRFYAPANKNKYDAIYSANFNEIMPRFCEHYQRLESVAGATNITVLRGMEVDFFDTSDWYHGFERALKILKPDYIIGACHFIEYGGTLCNVHDMKNADVATQQKMLEMYWDKLRRAGQSGMFSWMAHIDLPKKVGIGGEERWAAVEKYTIDALATYKTPIEINTGGKRSGVPDPYPSERIMRMMAAQNIPVLLSDDAHSRDQIGREFETASQLANKCGIKNFINLEKLLDFRKKTL